MSTARGSRGTSTDQSELELPLDADAVEDPLDAPEAEPDEAEPDDDESDEEPESLASPDEERAEESEPESGFAPAPAVPRLSVLKKPDPLNVTPTGWKTFLTGMGTPDAGWTYSWRVSSVNACWTSMVSPVSTNL